MSLETMTTVTISGPEKMLDTAIRTLIINRDFHPQNARKALMHLKVLKPFESINPYTEQLDKCGALLNKMGISRQYRDFSEIDFNSNTLSEYFDKLNKQTDELISQKEETNQKLAHYRLTSEQLTHFSSLDVELSDLFNAHYYKCRLGRIPEELVPEFEKIIEERQDIYYFESEKSEHYRYGVYFVLPSHYQEVDLTLATHGFERIKIKADGELSVLISKVIKRLHSEMDEAQLIAENIHKEFLSLVEAETEKLLSVFAKLKFLSEAYEMRSFAGKRHGRFYLVGSIPLSMADEYEDKCDSLKDFECVIEEEYGSWQPPLQKKKFCLFCK